MGSEAETQVAAGPPRPRGLSRDHFELVLADFVEENAMACEGLLGVCRLEFTTEVSTLAVTLSEDPPRLLVNPEFVAGHIRSEEDARAVLLHEFLHVLLGHTKLFKKLDARTNLALDAVINHIVQRELGEDHAEFFRRFYEPSSAEDPVWLLRPHAEGDILPDDDEEASALYEGRRFYAASHAEGSARAVRLHMLRCDLGEGRVLADDVLDSFEEAGIRAPRRPDAGLPGHHDQPLGSSAQEGAPEDIVFLGNHDPEGSVHPENERRLDGVFKQLNGSGVFRRPLEQGMGGTMAEAGWAPADPYEPWRKIAGMALRRVIVEGPHGRATTEEEVSYLLPVAHAGDRRAALRSIWNPLLPDFSWLDRRPAKKGRVNIYLDVSGSMDRELEQLTGLLWRLRDWLNTPFYAFSNGVEPARFEKGRLVTSTTGGTEFNPVLQHIAEHRPGKALVITDGYIEPIEKDLLRRCRSQGEDVEVLVSGLGTTAPFDRAGIPATRLPEPPRQ